MSTVEKSAVTPLDGLARTLRGEPAYAREGHAARSLVHAPDLRVLLVAIRAGAKMAEHQATQTATVHLLSGALQLRVPGTTLDLVEGELLRLEAGLLHDVLAKTDSAFLLTLGHASSSGAHSATEEATSSV